MFQIGHTMFTDLGKPRDLSFNCRIYLFLQVGDLLFHKYYTPL